MESQNIEYKQSWKDDYRNSVVAEMMKTLNYVNMFNHGISEVQELLKENNSPEAEFNVNYVTAFSVVIRDEDVAYNTSTVHQLFTNLSTQDKSLIINLKEQQLSTSELQLFTSKQTAFYKAGHHSKYREWYYCYDTSRNATSLWRVGFTAIGSELKVIIRHA